MYLRTIYVQLKNITIMAEVINKTIQEHCSQFPDLLRDTHTVVRTFTKLLQLFRKCHRGYNSSVYMSDRKIDKLGKLHNETMFTTQLHLFFFYRECMAFYRGEFPWATIMPKMHVMEDHFREDSISGLGRWRNRSMHGS